MTNVNKKNNTDSYVTIPKELLKETIKELVGFIDRHNRKLSLNDDNWADYQTPGELCEYLGEVKIKETKVDQIEKDILFRNKFPDNDADKMYYFQKNVIFYCNVVTQYPIYCEVDLKSHCPVYSLHGIIVIGEFIWCKNMNIVIDRRPQ